MVQRLQPSDLKGVPYLDTYIFNVFSDVTLASSDGVSFETSRLFLSSISPLFYKIFKENDLEETVENFLILTEVHSTYVNFFLELSTKGKISSPINEEDGLKNLKDALETFGVLLSKLDLEKFDLESDDKANLTEKEGCPEGSTEFVVGNQQFTKHERLLSIKNPGENQPTGNLIREKMKEDLIVKVVRGSVSLSESCAIQNNTDTLTLASPWIMPAELVNSGQVQEIFETSLEDSNLLATKSTSGMADFNVDELLSSVGILPVSLQSSSLDFYPKSTFEPSTHQGNDSSGESSIEDDNLTQPNMKECSRKNNSNKNATKPSINYLKNLPPGLEAFPVTSDASTGIILNTKFHPRLTSDTVSIVPTNELSTNATPDELFTCLYHARNSGSKLISVHEAGRSTSAVNGQIVESFPVVNDGTLIQNLFVKEVSRNWTDKSRLGEEYSVIIIANSETPNTLERQGNPALAVLSVNQQKGDGFSVKKIENTTTQKDKMYSRMEKKSRTPNEKTAPAGNILKPSTHKSIVKTKRKKVGKSSFKNQVFPDLISMQNLPKRIGGHEFTSKEEETDQVILEKKCPYCPNVFIDENLLRYHVGKHETEPNLKEFLCGVCDENSFKTLEDLKTHRFEVHLEKNFCCTVCKRTFHGGEYENFKKHLSSHWRDNSKKDPPIRCVACGFTSAFKYNFEKHFTNWGPFHDGRCASCKERFATWEDHLNHVNTVHAGIFKYRCGLCDLILNSTKQQMAHRSQSHHSVGEGIGAFQRAEKVKRVRNHNRMECMTCGKFILTRHFEVHSSLHNPIGSFPCPKCRKVYSHPKILEEHLKHYHEEFPCHHCGVVLNERRKYDRHVLSLHTPDDEKPYQCTLCNPPKGFHRKLNYDDHVNTHTNNRPHRCRFCDETFSLNPSRYKHEKRCHGDLARKRTV